MTIIIIALCILAIGGILLTLAVMDLRCKLRDLEERFYQEGLNRDTQRG